MGAVRIFVGSLMGGAFGPLREAASSDIAVLGDPRMLLSLRGPRRTVRQSAAP